MSKDYSHDCPVCGKHKFPTPDSYHDCPVCGWCDEEYGIRHPDDTTLHNSVSLNEAKKNFKECGRADPKADKRASDSKDFLKDFMEQYRKEYEEHRQK